MKNLNRRDLCITLSAFAALGALTSEGQDSGTPHAGKHRLPGTPAPKTPEGPILSHSEAFTFAQLPVHHSANGGASRPVLQGVLPTGESVELHETTLPPGQMPHPPHRHRHSEFMLIREGTVEFNNDGNFEQVGPGGVFFAASERMHGLKNVGETAANYFVLAIGREQS